MTMSPESSSSSTAETETERTADRTAEGTTATGASTGATTGGERRLTTADFAAAADTSQTETRREPERAQGDRNAPLFAGNDSQGFQSRWSDIQASFVDEPRRAVEQADSLVAEVMQRLAQVFADERGKLEKQWSSGQETDTEALRQALRRYRSFFDRLLSM